MYKLLSLNVRGLNSSRKRRQVFRWLHQQQSDIIFLQETYSSPECIKRWETEWEGKIVYSHGSYHSRGVMILFKPRLDVDLEKIAADNFGRCILAETIIDGTKIVLVNKKMAFFPHWYQVEIKQISNLFDSCEGHFLSFDSFCNNFNVKCNFLQYYSILSYIQQNWKKLLQESSKDPDTPLTSICSLSCKAIYSILLNLECLPPPTSEKKFLASGVEKSDLKKVYLLPFKATKQIKLAMFQYKIIHRILPTNSLLHKMKKIASPSCPLCPSECQTLWHLFINCKHASSFWNRFQQWYSTSSNSKLSLSELEVMFGIFRRHTYCLALNQIFLIC